MTTRHLNFEPRSFGRRRPFVVDGAVAAPAPALSEDLKLFVLTYLAGFMFVSIFLA
jgi:hypothetical protein